MEKIKEFENAVMEAISALREELGAKRIVISVQIDQYEKSCQTDVKFFTSIPMDASLRCPDGKVE